MYHHRRTIMVNENSFKNPVKALLTHMMWCDVEFDMRPENDIDSEPKSQKLH